MNIGVYGSAAGSIPAELNKKAGAIGRQIAVKGHTLVTGACPGLPYEAVLGASEAGGKCLGFSPAINLNAHIQKDKFPTEGFTKLIFVSEDFIYADQSSICKKFRNIMSVAEIDAAIFISGRTGTMNEFTIAYDLGKKIGILKNSGGAADGAIQILLKNLGKETGAKIIYDADPISLVDKVIEL